MKIAAFICLIGFTIFSFRVIYRAFMPNLKVRSIDINLTAAFLGLTIACIAVVGSMDYRDSQRSEETVTLKQVAQIQRQIFKQQGEFGYKPDVLFRDPNMFNRDFEVYPGVDGTTVMLNTPRCEMVLFPGRSIGPTCGKK